MTGDGGPSPSGLRAPLRDWQRSPEKFAEIMKKPESLDRRKYARIRTDAVMAIRRVEDAAKLAHAVDLSIGGIRFHCVGLELNLGDVLEVTFNLGDQTATVVGKTLRLTDLDAFTQEVAIGFVEVDPEVLERFYELGLGDEEPQL
jgi:hypothetical protein